MLRSMVVASQAIGPTPQPTGLNEKPFEVAPSPTRVEPTSPIHTPGRRQNEAGMRNLRVGGCPPSLEGVPARPGKESVSLGIVCDTRTHSVFRTGQVTPCHTTVCAAFQLTNPTMNAVTQPN